MKGNKICFATDIPLSIIAFIFAAVDELSASKEATQRTENNVLKKIINRPNKDIKRMKKIWKYNY